MKISANDIRKRIYNLNESYSCTKMAYNEYIHEEAFNELNVSAITESLKSLRDIALSDTKNEYKAFNKMLDLFESVCDEKGYSSHEADIVIHYLNEVVDRVRTPKEMVTLLKRRISLGTKTRGVTKFSKKIEDNKHSDLGKEVSKNIENNTNSLSTKLQVPNIQTPTLDVKTGSSSSTEKDDKNLSENCDNYYKELINRCNVNAEVDRVLGNYNRLSKRFNVDRVIDAIGMDIPDNIDLFCDLFNTWSDKEMSKKSKFNIAIETALYINNKRNNPVNRESLIEAIVDYHLFKNMPFDTIYSYLESNSMITESDLAPYTKYYNKIHNIDQDFSIRSIIEAETENSDKNLSASIKQFKRSDKKDIKSFKDLIVKAYTKTPDQVINNAPKFFDIFRFFIIMGSFAINPILGLVSFFTDQFLKRSFSRDETNKMILKYEKEIDKIDKKISKCENDEKKKRLKEYKNTMEDGLYKLQDYERELYTDEEQEKKEEERDEKRDHSYSDDQYDWNFDEASNVFELADYMMNNVETYKIESFIKNHIRNVVKTGLIDEITNFAIRSDGFISINTLKSIYEDYYDTLKKAEPKRDYLSMAIVETNINKLSEGYINSDNVDSIKLMESYYLFNEAFKMIDQESPYFLEVSFQNTFNVVKNKVHDAVKTMSDKEKEFSSKIDISVSGFQNDVENFFKSSSRESILKGRILPRASKIIKGALAFGITSWLVHPVVAVIGVLGYIGVSKLCQNKERKAILDEIDVELEMVDRYIQVAEQKDDLKAVRNLLMTKKRLQKEKIRIKYKMKMNGDKLTPEDLK